MDISGRRPTSAFLGKVTPNGGGDDDVDMESPFSFNIFEGGPSGGTFYRDFYPFLFQSSLQPIHANGLSIPQQMNNNHRGTEGAPNGHGVDDGHRELSPWMTHPLDQSPHQVLDSPISPSPHLQAPPPSAAIDETPSEIAYRSELGKQQLMQLWDQVGLFHLFHTAYMSIYTIGSKWHGSWPSMGSRI